jgi:hypothetical protein
MRDDQLPEITCRDDWGNPQSVYLLHGTIERGIGYCEGNAVVISGGLTQPGPLEQERWMWSSSDGRYFTVNARGTWKDLGLGFGPDSGWKLY